MAVPLHEQPAGFFVFGVVELRTTSSSCLTIGSPAVVQQLGRRGRADPASTGLAAASAAHGLDDLLLDELQVVRIDAAGERVRPPQAERVRALVVVRAADTRT